MEREGLETQEEARHILVLSAAFGNRRKRVLHLHHWQQKGHANRKVVVMKMYYEKINMSLHQVIKNRRQFKKYFT